MESLEQRQLQAHRREISDRGVRDQVRQYRVVLEKCYSGGVSEIVQSASVDNFQLEGRMNMTKDTAYQVLIDAKYSPEEAGAYLDSIPRRQVDRKIFVDAEKWDADQLYRKYKENEFNEQSARLLAEVL